MWPSSIRIFYGQATDSLADVYLEIFDADVASSAICCQIKGPYSSQARTLPFTTRFEPFDPPRLWRARVVDPCFWSLDQPSLYRVTLDLGDERFRWNHFGIRRLGRDRQNLWLEGKRWVVRGACWPESVRDADWDAWREVRLAMLVANPSRAICQQASEQGVPLIVRITPTGVAEELAAFSRWAAVCAAVLDDAHQVDPTSLRQAAPNLLLGTVVGKVAKQISTPFAPWADLALCAPDRELLTSALAQQPQRCIIAQRAAGPDLSAADARMACEQLQRDLAPEFDLSGYLV